jgi:hypothetical protein
MEIINITAMTPAEIGDKMIGSGDDGFIIKAPGIPVWSDTIKVGSDYQIVNTTTVVICDVFVEPGTVLTVTDGNGVVVYKRMRHIKDNVSVCPFSLQPGAHIFKGTAFPIVATTTTTA